MRNGNSNQGANVERETHEDDWEPIRREIQRTVDAEATRQAELAQSLVDDFVAELEQAGVQPGRHSRVDGQHARSVTVLGWSLSGCDGSRAGCGRDCAIVITPNGELARMAAQPTRRLLRLPRPTYGPVLGCGSYDENALKPLSQLEYDLRVGRAHLLRR